MIPAASIPASLAAAPLEAAPPTALPASPALTGQIAPAFASASGSAAPAPFADLVIDSVQQVQSLEARAKTEIEGLISGQGVDVHEAMIAAQKASMGFELVLSVRNKALAAYQQVMGMQF